MKKVIIFNASASLYGAERGLLNIIRALGGGFDITVVIPKNGPLAERIKKVSSSVNIMVFPLAVLTFSLSPLYFAKFIFLFFVDFFFFLFYINYNNIDIVSTNSLLLAFPALCARLLNKPHIWHIREVFPYTFVNYFLSCYIKVFSYRVICQSAFIKQKLHLKHRTNIVYEPLDKEDYGIYSYNEARRMLKLPLKATVVSVISRIHPAKGQYEFLLNSQELLHKNRNIVILIAGDMSISTFRNRRYKRKIEEFVRKHNLRNVVILGFIENIGLVLSATDICVFPFRRAEPFGIAAAEALACGLDSFYPFSGGLREVYDMFKEGKEFRIDEVIREIKDYNRFTRKTVVFNVPSRLSLMYYKNTIVKAYGNVA